MKKFTIEILEETLKFFEEEVDKEIETEKLLSSMLELCKEILLIGKNK